MVRLHNTVILTSKIGRSTTKIVQVPSHIHTQTHELTHQNKCNMLTASGRLVTLQAGKENCD